MNFLKSTLFFILLLCILDNYLVKSDSGFNYNSDQMKMIECLLFQGEYTSCSHSIETPASTEAICSNFPTVGTENNA